MIRQSGCNFICRDYWRIGNEIEWKCPPQIKDQWIFILLGARERFFVAPIIAARRIFFFGRAHGSRRKSIIILTAYLRLMSWTVRTILWPLMKRSVDQRIVAAIFIAPNFCTTKRNFRKEFVTRQSLPRVNIIVFPDDKKARNLWQVVNGIIFRIQNLWNLWWTIIGTLLWIPFYHSGSGRNSRSSDCKMENMLRREYLLAAHKISLLRP